jgi:hypothetical protein
MWQTEMIVILRHMINDIVTPYKFTDQRLEELILVAAQFAQDDITFKQSYALNFDELSLTPDPTASATRDDSFINLTLLKAACMVDGSNLRMAAGQAIDIKDGSSSISLRGALAGRLAVYKEGWCKDYTQSKFEFEAGNVGAAGAIVLSPYRTNSGYPSRSEGRYR